MSSPNKEVHDFVNGNAELELLTSIVFIYLMVYIYINRMIYKIHVMEYAHCL